MSSNLRVQELDFDTIKTNLVNFMRDKPEFSDYDFAGSGLSALMNVLSYHTHYLAVLANMQMGEMYLDTATKRVTAALHASRLGYVAGSMKSPIAKVNLEIFPTGDPDTLTIGRGATFSTTVFGEQYSFVTTEAKTISRSSTGRYLFESLELREGELKQFRYRYSTTDDKKFEIPSKNVDINTLIVRVVVSESNSTSRTFQRSKSIAYLNSESLAYFVRLNQRGFYEVYFGDGVISKALDDGNIIFLEYIETNGDLANGAINFTFDDTVQGHSSNLVTLVQAASGGALDETAEEIKVNAQANTSVQNRAVAGLDYKAIIKDVYPVSSISVWGGEKNSPPVYGKVFIAIKPIGGTTVLTDATKEYIETELIKSKNVLTVTPVIVDPEYVNLEIDSTVYFDDTSTTYSASTIEALVAESIMSFASTNLGQFENNLRYTKLTTRIDSVDQSILSNITKIKMRKEFYPNSAYTAGFSLGFGNPIIQSTPSEQNIKSSGFYVVDSTNKLYLDDVDGILRLYYLDGGTKRIYSANAGTVDYITGTFSFNAINIRSADDNLIRITVIPKSNDVFSIRENILSLSSDDITVSAIADEIDPTSRIFTESR